MREERKEQVSKRTTETTVPLSGSINGPGIEVDCKKTSKNTKMSTKNG